MTDPYNTDAELNTAILNLLPVDYGYTLTQIAEKIFGGGCYTGRWASAESRRKYSRVRRRLQALMESGAVRRDAYNKRYTNATREAVAEYRRREAAHEAKAEKVRAAAEALGLLKGEDDARKLADLDDENDLETAKIEIEYSNRRKLQSGYGIELTNDEFLSLCRKAGVVD